MCTAYITNVKYKCRCVKPDTRVDPCSDDDCAVIKKTVYNPSSTNRIFEFPDCRGKNNPIFFFSLGSTPRNSTGILRNWIGFLLLRLLCSKRSIYTTSVSMI